MLFYEDLVKKIETGKIEDIKKMEKDGEIEIYHREKLTELLNKYPTKITELLDKDVRYSIEDIKRYIKTMQI